MIFLREQLNNILKISPTESSQYLIAKEILNRLKFNLPLNSSEIAKETFTSKPTVIRFAQSLGFLGFKEFRTELLKEEKEYIFEATAKNYNESFEEYNNTLNHLMYKALKEKTILIEIAKIIKENKKIFIFTNSEHAFLGVQFATKLGLLGISAFTIMTNQLFLRNQIKLGDLVLFLVSGLDVSSVVKTWNEIKGFTQTIAIATTTKLVNFDDADYKIKIDVGPNLLRIQLQKFLFAFVLDQIYNLLVYSDVKFIENINQEVYM